MTVSNGRLSYRITLLSKNKSNFPIDWQIPGYGDFYARESDLVLREKGAELEVSEQRGKELIAKGFAAEVKPKEEKKTESKN